MKLKELASIIEEDIKEDSATIEPFEVLEEDYDIGINPLEFLNIVEERISLYGSDAEIDL